MRLTSKGRYAVRAMLDLTTHSNGNPVRLQEISERQNISLHYLEQLFRKLRNGQAVKSVRGPGGGYVLARAMDEISIKDVLDCVGENINPAKDILGTEAEVANTVEFHLSKNYFQNLLLYNSLMNMDLMAIISSLKLLHSLLWDHSKNYLLHFQTQLDVKNLVSEVI